MFYPDLSNDCQVDSGPYVRSIGWLSCDHAFPTGTVSPEFLDALLRHIREPWQPVAAGGAHRCEFCSPRPDGRFTGGSRNIWIPADGVVYVAPELVLHYIEAHGYLPPADFITAVLACPEQDSDAYRAQMRLFPAWWVEYLSASEQRT
jgi:hypothetical protein